MKRPTFRGGDGASVPRSGGLQAAATAAFGLVRNAVAGDGASLGDRPTVRWVGFKDEDGIRVWREDDRGAMYQLAPRTDLVNHSPTGFGWGYLGSGPSQLALAILADCLGAVLALQLYQDFQARMIATIAGDSWTLDLDDVEEWAAAELAELEGGGPAE
jgi:hypothetical protein